MEKEINTNESTDTQRANQDSPCYLCVWREDEDGSWWSDCDNGFIFNDAGPHENKFEFCPYCGKEITVNLFCDNVQSEPAKPQDTEI